MTSSTNGDCGETAQHIEWMSTSDLFVGCIWPLMGRFCYVYCVAVSVLGEKKRNRSHESIIIAHLRFIDGWSTYRVNTLIEETKKIQETLRYMYMQVKGNETPNKVITTEPRDPMTHRRL